MQIRNIYALNLIQCNTPIANMASITRKRGFSVATVAKGKSANFDLLDLFVALNTWLLIIIEVITNMIWIDRLNVGMYPN